MGLLFNISGLLPVNTACHTLKLLVPVPGDIHVFLFCGWEGDISLGG